MRGSEYKVEDAANVAYSTFPIPMRGSEATDGGRTMDGDGRFPIPMRVPDPHEG